MKARATSLTPNNRSSRAYSRRKRRSPVLVIFILLGLIGICLGTALIGFIAWNIPTWAEQTYGPPASHLNLRDRFYLSAYLLVNREALGLPGSLSTGEQPFEVELGESTASVIARLNSEGLIRDPDVFRAYLQYTGLDTTLQAGDYVLSPAMTPVEIARALQDATPAEVSFHILPGWRLEEIAASLPTSGLTIRPEIFMDAAAVRPEGYSFSADMPPDASIEGFIFPDSYQLSRDLTVTGLLKTFLDRFEAQLAPNMVEGFHRQGLNVYEAVTLASLVEREAVSAEEMPLIASVFLNRLAAGIKLDSDPTVQYALGFNFEQSTWWTNPLSLDDLQVDSPYNTYLYPGLPPGPIANPSLAALQAVAFPAQTPYYYFRSACDSSGKHVFAETFEEHIQNACP